MSKLKILRIWKNLINKSVVAFRGNDWLDEYSGAVHDHDHVDWCYSLKFDGHHFAYLDGCVFEDTSLPVVVGFNNHSYYGWSIEPVAIDPLLFKYRELGLQLRKATPEEAKPVAEVIGQGRRDFDPFDNVISDILNKAMGQAGAK
jgi:hypothetical protein